MKEYIDLTEIIKNHTDDDRFNDRLIMAYGEDGMDDYQCVFKNVDKSLDINGEKKYFPIFISEHLLLNGKIQHSMTDSDFSNQAIGYFGQITLDDLLEHLSYDFEDNNFQYFGTMGNTRQLKELIHEMIQDIVVYDLKPENSSTIKQAFESIRSFIGTSEHTGKPDVIVSEYINKLETTLSKNYPNGFNQDNKFDLFKFKDFMLSDESSLLVKDDMFQLDNMKAIIEKQLIQEEQQLKNHYFG